MEINRQRFFLRDEQGRRLFLLFGPCLRPWVAPDRDAENWLLRRLPGRWWDVLLPLPFYVIGGMLIWRSPLLGFLFLFVSPALVTLVARRLWLAGDLRTWQRVPRLSLRRHMRLRARQTAPATIKGALVGTLLVVPVGLFLATQSEIWEVGALLVLFGAPIAAIQWRLLWLARREPQPLPAADEPADGSIRDVTGGIHEQS